MRKLPIPHTRDHSESAHAALVGSAQWHQHSATILLPIACIGSPGLPDHFSISGMLGWSF
jgi:hypothetical protein